MSFATIEPEQFARRLERGELANARIIDVREPAEWEYYHWEEAQLIPMNTIPAKLDELPQDREIYVICAHGVRSANVCHYMSVNGFDKVINVEGGMAALGALRGFAYD